MGDITEQKATKRRRIVLRLDDGSLIAEGSVLFDNASDGAALLTYEEAYRLGKAGQKEVDRLRELIDQYAARNSADPNTVRASALKPFNPYTQDGQRALKRQKSLANGDVIHVASPESNQAVPADFVSKCWEVLSKVYGSIGPREVLFGLPVKDIFYKSVHESFPTVAAEYYRIISNPITLKEIEERLNSAVYTQPQQFAEDMRLVFQNCRIYNVDPNQPVRKIGDRLSDAFEQGWAASGLCSESRAKRATAGVAAAKFEPDDDQLVQQQQQPARTKSHSRGQPPRNGQRQADGLDRTWSHEVASYQDDMAGVVEQQPVDDALVEEVANAIGDLEDPETALNLFNEGVVNPTPDGEVELDFGAVTMEALIRVDTYIRQQKGLPPREYPSAKPAAAAAPAPPPQPPPPPAAAAAPAAPRPPPRQAAAVTGRKRGARVIDDSDSDFEEDDSDSDDD